MLDSSNWKQVKDGGETWLVEFFAPWCGHCQQLKGPYKELAKGFKGVEGFKIGAVDADGEGRSLGSRYGVRGFPTLKIFKGGKPQDYQGPRDAGGMAAALLQEGGADQATAEKVQKQGGFQLGGGWMQQMPYFSASSRTERMYRSGFSNSAAVGRKVGASTSARRCGPETISRLSNSAPRGLPKCRRRRRFPM